MGCEQWREVLSAYLDNEVDRSEGRLVEAHLADCADCRRWLDRAAAVTRLARTSLVGATPDLSGVVLETAYARRGRLARALRVALAGVGGLQLALGLAHVGQGPAGGTHSSHGATPWHLWHESAAWNVALGAGFLFVALRRSRPGGLLPTLTPFVVMLALLSVNDLVIGRVEASRLLSHGFVLAGYLLVLALAWRGLDPNEPPAQRRPRRPRWRVRFDEVEPAVPAPRLRLVPPASAGRPAQPHARGYREQRRAA